MVFLFLSWLRLDCNPYSHAAPWWHKLLLLYSTITDGVKFHTVRRGKDHSHEHVKRPHQHSWNIPQLENSPYVESVLKPPTRSWQATYGRCALRQRKNRCTESIPVDHINRKHFVNAIQALVGSSKFDFDFKLNTFVLVLRSDKFIIHYTICEGTISSIVSSYTWQICEQAHSLLSIPFQW